MYTTKWREETNPIHLEPQQERSGLSCARDSTHTLSANSHLEKIPASLPVSLLRKCTRLGWLLRVSHHILLPEWKAGIPAAAWLWGMKFLQGQAATALGSGATSVTHQRRAKIWAWGKWGIARRLLKPTHHPPREELEDNCMWGRREMYGMRKLHWAPPGKLQKKEIEKCDIEGMRFMCNSMFIPSHCLLRGQ